MTTSETMTAQYNRREKDHDPYDPLNVDVMTKDHELDRHFARILKPLGPLKDLALLEIGCGWGMNLARFVQFGFTPGNLCGVDLIADRVKKAATQLPASVRLFAGDGRDTPDFGRFDIVFQSTVFSSILCRQTRKDLAKTMLARCLRGILWYDLAIDNPRNQDVRGVPLSEIRNLFSNCHVDARRITLAPPIARWVAFWPLLYSFLRSSPSLRTHLICWIEKP